MNEYVDGVRPPYREHSVREHILVVEKAMGKRLPKGACVHHVDEDKSNNKKGNLVVCPDQAYHQLLHRRQRAFDASGHYDWKYCFLCKQHDDPKNLTTALRPINGKLVERSNHPSCFSEYRRRVKSKREGG